MTDMERFEQEFEEVGGRFIAPLRVNKVLDRAAFDELTEMTRTGERLLVGQDSVPRSLVSKTLYLYLAMQTQAAHAKDGDAIAQAAKDYLDRIYQLFAVG